VEQARQLFEDGRASVAKGLPAGRRLGVEGVAWLARLDAEWARLRWLADVDPPSEQDHVALWQATVAGFDAAGGFGSVFDQARARTRLAAVLRAAGRGAEATEQADLARTAARALRAEPLLAEIRALGTSPADRSGNRPGRGVSALTVGAAEVLALLVEGRTNRQIARQLYISEKTASVHVSNILAKLGVRSRTEAAAVARAG
jgi:DNA-binding NarL/FixJ family response regulator